MNFHSSTTKLFDSRNCADDPRIGLGSAPQRRDWPTSPWCPLCANNAGRRVS